jgi:hypothetical protein
MRRFKAWTVRLIVAVVWVALEFLRSHRPVVRPNPAFSAEDSGFRCHNFSRPVSHTYLLSRHG